MADHRAELARKQPGYLGITSCRAGEGFGFTVSCWRSDATNNDPAGKPNL